MLCQDETCRRPHTPVRRVGSSGTGGPVSCSLNKQQMFWFFCRCCFFFFPQKVSGRNTAPKATYFSTLLSAYFKEMRSGKRKLGWILRDNSRCSHNLCLAHRAFRSPWCSATVWFMLYIPVFCGVEKQVCGIVDQDSSMLVHSGTSSV